MRFPKILMLLYSTVTLFGLWNIITIDEGDHTIIKNVKKKEKKGDVLKSFGKKRVVNLSKKWMRLKRISFYTSFYVQVSSGVLLKAPTMQQ